MARSRKAGWLLLPVLLAAAGCARRVVDMGDSNADRLPRTLSILRTASPEQPKVLRVLFYGQSISTPKWTDIAERQLRAAYPNVRFEFRNLAIGGFAAARLERAAARDLDEAYPDLIVFHVFGDHHAYERIIRLMRSRTAAEIVVQTDHVQTPPQPVCPQGYRLWIGEIEGCTGRWFKYHQTWWDDQMSGKIVPDIAEKYGLALEPRRQEWIAYLNRTHQPFQALLEDGLHPNAQGWRLVSALFTNWLKRQAATWNGQQLRFTTDLPAPKPGAQTIAFDGNRIELIADAPLGDGAKAAIDGKPPTALDGCWQTSRATSLEAAPDWPGIKRVTIDPAFHRPERWTATIYHAGDAADHFSFTLANGRGEADGEGTTDKDFVSPSGRVRIAAQDWVPPEIVAVRSVNIPDGVQTSWEHRFVCTAQPAVALAAGRQEVRTLLATGIANGPHQLRLTLTPEAARHITAIRVYRPPLIETAEAG